LDGALEDGDAELSVLEVQTKQRIALSYEGGITCPDLKQLHAVTLGLKSCIALLERETVDLLPLRGKHKLVEIELGKLAQTGGGGVFKLDFGKPAFPRGQLETFRNRKVHRRRGPFLHVGPLDRDRPFHETEAHHAHMRICLSPGLARKEKQNQA
jgi:hypothetical protein